LSGEYDKALAWLSELHRKVPDQPDVQHLILDTLFAKNSTVGNYSLTHHPHGTCSPTGATGFSLISGEAKDSSEGYSHQWR
jgi:hypothetical protein